MILQWVLARRPGQCSRIGNELRVNHTDGDVSSFWQKDILTLVPPELEALSIYSEIDGADLFSSAFKVASISERRSRNGVVIVPKVADLSKEAERLGCQFPDGAIPFMIQAGIGLYAVKNRAIYEWDASEGGISCVYQDLTSVFAEWLAAID